MTTRSWQDLMNEATSGGAVDPGPYEVEVSKATYKPSQNGKPMWVVVFKVAAGPNAGAPIYNNFVLSDDNPNALGIFFRHMAVLGLDGEFFSMIPDGQAGYEIVAQALVGKKAKIDVSQREWPKGSGQMRNQVDDVQASMYGANEPVRQIPQAGVPGSVPNVPQQPVATQPAQQPQAQPVAQPQPAPGPAQTPAPAQPVASPAQPQATPQMPAQAPQPQPAPAQQPVQPQPEPQPAPEPTQEAQPQPAPDQAQQVAQPVQPQQEAPQEPQPQPQPQPQQGATPSAPPF